MENLIKTMKGKKTSLVSLLTAVFTTTMLLLILLAVIEGTISGVLLKLITNFNEYSYLIIICIISNIFMTITLFIVFILFFKKVSSNFGNIVSSINSGDLSIANDFKKYKLLDGLSDHLNSITSEMRKIVEGTYELTKAIINASLNMSDKVSQATSSITEIEKTINQIAIGASEQALETQKSVDKMEELSNHIILVNNSYYNVIEETNNVNNLNSEGLKIVKKLKEKSDDYNISSEKIFVTVQNLIATIDNIGLLVDTIESISKQTNLLALNAAIEASKAGEAGKGFAVVSDGVRKLAEESRQSTEKIRNMMNNIKNESTEAISAMKLMQIVSNEQLATVDQTENSFNRIAEAINLITLKINYTSDTIKEMEKLKNDSLTSIGHTANLSEQAAAATEELVASSESQLKIFEEMSTSAVKLQSLAQNMDNSLKKYKI